MKVNITEGDKVIEQEWPDAYVVTGDVSQLDKAELYRVVLEEVEAARDANRPPVFVLPKGVRVCAVRSESGGDERLRVEQVPVDVRALKESLEAMG